MIWLLYMAAGWTALGIVACREEIADVWRSYHQRAVLRSRPCPCGCGNPWRKHSPIRGAR
ncbi:hypothetical protein ACFWOG_04535 [Kitasatospora sp. NPDC058406]|uniref:hypothetical protein n=1 Tax=Kitasatospora sp. NPDC058406 TaxID=3346483 RepID=UPI003654F89C